MDSIKKWFIIIGGIFFSMVLIWFGIRMLSRPVGAASTIELVLLGCGITLCGLVMVGTDTVVRNFGLVFILIGFYYFARAHGSIANPWLTRVIGLASIGSAGVIGYSIWEYLGQVDDTPKAAKL